MCENAAAACRSESNVEACMRDLFIQYPIFCPSAYSLIINRDYYDNAMDPWTAGHGHVATGSPYYQCNAACTNG